jgi:hypothetical protein
MAKCEEGYLCEVCGQDVAELTESDLYLRYVIGLLDPEVLHTSRERHIRCDPTLAQFIVDDDFSPVAIAGQFDKRVLDQEYVRQQETLVTRGFRRLKELAGLDLPILDYPLPEVRAAIEHDARGALGVEERGMRRSGGNGIGAPVRDVDARY